MYLPVFLVRIDERTKNIYCNSCW
ncbi:MAG: DUF6888 family protein [Nostoc sp. CreGUA01]